MRRFFVDPRSIYKNIASLSPAESQHIVAALRLRPGDLIELFDGTGSVYLGELLKLSREKVTVKLLRKIRRETDETPSLFLLQSLLKGKKMDFLIQKATELGVDSFQPVITRYCHKRSSQHRQQERWQRIMLEACKQCNRPLPMNIQPLVDFAEIPLDPSSLKLLLWEGELRQPLEPHLFPKKNSVYLFVGPEGGFSQQEVVMAREKGFQSVSLGKQTLRAETASLAAIAIVQYLLGIFNS